MRKGLYLHSTILRGRRLRDENEVGGATPNSGGNNIPAGGGNPQGESGNPGENTNNTGDTFNPATFWDSPTPAPAPAPSGESAGNGSQGSGTPGQGGFAEQLTSQLSSMTFGDPILTPEVSEEISQGNFTNFEKRLQAQQQQVVRQALAMQVQILRPFAEQLMTQMRNEFGSTLSERDDQSQLIKDFPSASNPVVAPIIKGIYDQALVRTNGNRPEAVRQTKAMLAHMASQTASDLDLSIAPQGAGDSRPSQPAINWLDELTGR
jgi:hypothetical protein